MKQPDLLEELNLSKTSFIVFSAVLVVVGIIFGVGIVLLLIN